MTTQYQVVSLKTHTQATAEGLSGVYLCVIYSCIIIYIIEYDNNITSAMNFRWGTWEEREGEIMHYILIKNKIN